MALPVTATLPQGETIIEAQQGKPAPDFTVQDPAGNLHSLSSYQGRPVVLYFWASWCPYCIDEMPGLNRLAETYREQGLVVLAVNILEQPAKVRHFLQGMNVSYPVLLDLDGHVTRSFLIRATPTYVFIDAEGVYRDQYIGTPRSGVLEAKIHALLHTTP